MKKGSSGKRKEQRTHTEGHYPTREERSNVYSLQRERQRRAKLSHEGEQAVHTYSARRRRRGRQMLIPLLVFAIIAFYLLGQIGRLAARRADIDVETVSYGTIDTPEVYTGLILRSEYVVESNRAGQPFYQYAQGDYVTKGTVVCTVKETETTDKLESKLESIDRDILESGKATADLSAFAEDISRLESNIGRTVDAYAGRAMGTNVSYMYTMKSSVSSFMEQRNEIWLTENVESLSALTEEKSLYEKQLAKSQSALTATEAGVLCLSYDGLEESLQPEQADVVTKKQIGESKVQYISKTKELAKGDPAFKIITDNKWYLVAYLPNTVTAGWKAGKTSRTLNLLTEDETYQIQADVEALTEGKKETKVVFSSYEHMESFMEDRTVSFSLQGAVAEGLKIPNEAIVEKSLLKIPKSCLTESAGNTGVLLQKGEKTRFVDVTTVSEDDAAVYLEQKDSGLSLGDVILEGTGENATQYTLSEMTPHAGVYVANSSIARFVAVDIIEQNQEYAIVEAGSITGLQPYDTIVSDAKNIQEGDNIF